MTFSIAEYRDRLGRLQRHLGEKGLAAILLTTDADIRYISGFLTRFWESPSRAWYLLVPVTGDPVAVIPAIGAHLMGQGWITDIRTWPAPYPPDDGVSLLCDAIAERVPKDGAIGLPDHDGTHLRMPLADFEAVKARTGLRFTGDGGVMRATRMVKSEAEIEAIRATCAIADRAFARVPEIARAGIPLSRVFRRFQALLLEEGADWVPYLAGASAPGGYGDVISPADDRPLAEGDVLMLDTGAIHRGYFCDFDRNFSVGPPSAAVADAHRRLIEATQAGLDAARPGVTCAELFGRMDSVLTGGAAPPDTGRLGHGLGMQLTEPPSILPWDDTVLEAGMVLTLEPGIDLGQGRIMVHEENIVVRESGAEWLSTPAAPEITVI